MTRRYAAIAIALVTALAFAAPRSVAQTTVSGEACLAQVRNALGREQRWFEAVLLGKPKASDERIGAVWFDKEGVPFMKTDDNVWKTTKGDGEQISDAQMTERSEKPMKLANEEDAAISIERTSILATTEEVTSNLLPSLIQSMRALRCRLKAVCRVMQLSQSKDAADPLIVKPDGCLAFEEPPFKSCAFQGTTDYDDPSQVIGACDKAMNALIDQQMSVVEMVVAYDASYRQLLRFAGEFEQFLEEFRFTLLTPLWQTVGILQEFNRIPCFASQCDI